MPAARLLSPRTPEAASLTQNLAQPFGPHGSPIFAFFTMHVTCKAAALASALPSCPLESPGVDITSELPVGFSSTIGAHIACPSASAVGVSRVPALVHAGLPLEIELDATCPRRAITASVARIISTQAVLSVVVVSKEKPHASISVPVSVRPSRGGWVARALTRPSTWAGADSVSVLSLSLLGRPLPGDVLPVIRRVGYNHAPTPAGAVHAAVVDADASRLQAALDAGGSTEEADSVRVERGACWPCGPRRVTSSHPRTHPPASVPLLLGCRQGALPCGGLPSMATQRAFACSSQQAPTRLRPPR